MASNPDLATSNLGRVKPITLKLILVAPWPGARHYEERARTVWLSVGIMQLSGTAGHCAGGLVFQCRSTMKSPWVRTVTSLCPSPYRASLSAHQVTLKWHEFPIHTKKMSREGISKWFRGLRIYHKTDNQSSLLYRCARGDIIEIYKYISELYPVKVQYIKLEISPKETRGQKLRIQNPRTIQQLMKYFVLDRATNTSKRLPPKLAEAPSLNAWKNNRYILESLLV